MNKLIFFALILFAYTGCKTTSHVRDLVIVDQSGNPLSGVSEAHQSPVPFAGTKISNANGRLKVFRDYPVLIKKGYRPVLARFDSDKVTVVTMENSTLSGIELTREVASLMRSSTELEAAAVKSALPSQ